MGAPTLDSIQPASDPSTSLGLADGAPEVRLFVRLAIPAALAFAIVDLLLAFAFGDVSAFIAAAGLTGFAVWAAAWCLPRIGRVAMDRLVWRLALGMFVPIVMGGFLLRDVVALATLIPLGLALPYLSRRALSELGLLAVGLAVLVALSGEALPPSDAIPREIQTALTATAIATVFGLVALLVSQFAARLRSTSHELANVIELSTHLAQTLDPREIGDLTARHVAIAIGADECGICYWDEEHDRILTYGYYPPDRRTAIDESYALADYPATRVVLERHQTLIVNDTDPSADVAEVAYLHSIGQRAMATLPLLAKGRALGAIEATSRSPGYFDERRIRLARTLAAEAGLALENSRLYEELRHQAFHDSLTGLANRALFQDRVERAVGRRPSAPGRLVAVLFLDLDDFKTVNESLGHVGGDQLLAAVADRLGTCLRAGDTAARLGGDEFAILLEDIDDEAAATDVAQRIIDALRQPIRIGTSAALIATSIGIAASPPGRDSATELLRNADFAMYQAKHGGKGRYEVFRSNLRDSANERAALEGLLRRAEERDELRLHYQPIVDLADGSIVGVEALVRWEAPDRGLLMPGDFIGLAEESGLIVSIGRWVLEQACRQTEDWQQRHGLDSLSVGVNLSARQFQHPDLIAEVGAALAASGLEPSCLILEITESVLMQTTAATIGKLADLRRIGVRLAIDDFGTGYSSLGYLERFPVDILKIDKTFIDGIGERGGRPVLARAIVQLGRALDLQVVAEGIERPDQASVLRRLGCIRGQGYLYSRPLPPVELEPMLARGAVDLPGRPATRATGGPANGPTSEPIPIRRSHGAA
jgi:diguanylate cyclase (GGDEF)-like protein